MTPLLSNFNFEFHDLISNLFSLFYSLKYDR